MTADEIEKARNDIEATEDLLERAMKLSGLVPDFKVSNHLAELKAEMSHA